MFPSCGTPGLMPRDDGLGDVETSLKVVWCESGGEHEPAEAEREVSSGLESPQLLFDIVLHQRAMAGVGRSRDPRQIARDRVTGAGARFY